MRAKRATRVVIVMSALSGLVACGIDVLASGQFGVAPDASAEGGPTAMLPDAASDVTDDGSEIVLPPGPDPFLDAGLDVNPTNCAAVCSDGGTCDGGWCVFDCEDAKSCDHVTCPAGVPCDVKCRGAQACDHGVDCTRSSACRVDCEGSGTCVNGPIGCSGVACELDCNGSGSCRGGVDCDASACTISCLGDGTCINHAVGCSGDTCTVRCGVPGNGGATCTDGVNCDTTRLCDIGCIADHSCRNDPIHARSGGTTIVACPGLDTCTNGADLSGAGEAGILCLGDQACGQRTYCDAGKCSATCEKDDLSYCCVAGAGKCDLVGQKGCTIKNACP